MPKRAKKDDKPDAETEVADGLIDGFTTLSGAPSNDPRALEKALGLRVRQLRRQQDLSVADLAAAAGLSTGMLSKIENGQISASLTSIQSLAQALSVPISSLFALAEERHDVSFVAASQGVKIERRGTKSGHVYQLLGHLRAGDVAVEPYLITLSDGASPYTSFSHAGTELIHMLEGNLVYRHGDRRFELSPGDTLLFDSQAQHGPETMGPGTLRYLSIIVYPRGNGAA
ncbi:MULTISPECIES: XRE family transcriptional regulator [unclassified Sphingomonas]|uniref:helix-turn-helix domain-containing protein n=1 Tax=Novosphingobium rhizosphaerae TaxID=1551649 RepID=UPI0015C81E15